MIAIQIGQCKECRWWLTREKRIARGKFPVRGIPDDWGECERTRGGGKPDNTDSLAWARDAEEYFAVLVTSPEFGCLQFEPLKPRDCDTPSRVDVSSAQSTGRH